MAHALETIDGKTQFAYAGELPWHGLGTKVPSDLTPEQIMDAAGLNWEVEKYPLYADINGRRVFSDKQALVRVSDEKVLDVVGKDWNPVQNIEAFQFFNDFIAAGEMEMHTAGSLRGGKNVFALAKVNESFEILGKDRVDGYLLFSNPHQYGKAIEVRFTPIRVVCANTLAMAMGSSFTSRFSAGHRSEFNPDLAKEALGISKEKLTQYKEMAEHLASKRFTNENIVEYFNRVFPATSGAAKDEGKLASRAARTAFEALEDQPGAELGEGTWWAAFNAVTYTTDHLLGRSADTRMQSAWFGVNQARKIQAANLAMEMANA
jgi:phage/plasmid-like protein (TIGR03299 family)